MIGTLALSLAVACAHAIMRACEIMALMVITLVDPEAGKAMGKTQAMSVDMEVDGLVVDAEADDMYKQFVASKETQPDLEPVTAEPFTTPSATYEARGPYDGVGEKVADFVKKYKDMQAELTEIKQRLAVAEDYKSKYEELKTEMDDILGNA